VLAAASMNRIAGIRAVVAALDRSGL